MAKYIKKQESDFSKYDECIVITCHAWKTPYYPVRQMRLRMERAERELRKLAKRYAEV